MSPPDPVDEEPPELRDAEPLPELIDDPPDCCELNEEPPLIVC